MDYKQCDTDIENNDMQEANQGYFEGINLIRPPSPCIYVVFMSDDMEQTPCFI